MPLHRCLLLATFAATASSSWVYVAGENAVDGCGMACGGSDPRFRCLGTFKSPQGLQECEVACNKTASCAIVTYSTATGNCWERLDGVWDLTASTGTTSGCDTSRVPACNPPPPYSDLNVTVSVGAPAGVPMHPLGPAFALDFWLSTDPTYGEKWGSSGVLTIDLDSPMLNMYSSALAPAILRLGGSPEDSIVFDADGTCSPGGGDGPFPGYYCSQVRPYTYGCLTPARWEAILAFADRVGFKIAFGFNGCYGRSGPDAPMDYSNARAIMEATAASAHAGALAYWELSNEVVPQTIHATSYVADLRVLRNMSEEIFSTRGLAPPGLVGPDQADGIAVNEVVDALHNETGVLSAITYHQYPQCESDSTGTFAMSPSCLAKLPQVALATSSVSSTIPGLAAWSGEGADHSGGGVAGLTDTFRSSFYYATQIGSLPLNGVELMARQCLSGGDYELLQRFSNASFAPNPDFYIAWIARGLFRKGAQAFNVTSSAPPSLSGLQVFAFEGNPASGGSTTLMFVNAHLTNTYYARPLTLVGQRAEWHVTGDLTSPHAPVFINGVAMQPGSLPSLASIGVPQCCGNVIVVQPASIVFVAGS